MNDTRIPTSKPVDGRRVLLVEEADLFLGHATILRAAGWTPVHVDEVSTAIETLLAEPFAVIVTDTHLVNGTGIDLLRIVRSYDLDVPVVLMTSEASLETAIEAVELGAVSYLDKPLLPEELIAAVERGWRLKRSAISKRESLEVSSPQSMPPSDFIGLGVVFQRALESAWMAFQPIVDLKQKKIFAYEALLRSREPSLPSPPAVLDAAERLGRMFDVGQRVRTLIADRFSAIPDAEMKLFVNLHSSELLDPFLYSSDNALQPMAHSVVLEITERCSLDSVRDVDSCTRELRALGYRLALDDLGAGYAGLSSFTLLEPEVVKLDMSLVRDVHTDPEKQTIARAMVRLCHSLGIQVVAEGIETRDELDCIMHMGCDFGQGYFFARPAAAFEVALPEWGEA